jgi:hypothetical protein
MSKYLDKKVSKEKVSKELSLTSEELDFILKKLRSADYKGHEFETFFKIWTKVSSILQSLK